ncbi:unnamed protein product [Sphagnum troendelagicum]
MRNLGLNSVATEVGAGMHIMAWSEDHVVEPRSITAEGEVASSVPVEIDDEEAQLEVDEETQLEVDDAERGDIVAVRIKNFINAGIFPAIIKGAAIKDLKKTTSFLNQCGMRLIDKDMVKWFICLLDPCFNVKKPVVIKCTKIGASNVCTHLDKKHYITSSKTMATNKKLAHIKKQLDLSDPAFKKDPKRWFEVQLGAWSAEHSISYNAFTTCRWQLISRQLPVGEGGMKSINIRKLHVELYTTCKKIIIMSLVEARSFFTIKYLSLYLDLIKSKMSNQKYMALRVCFNTSTRFNIGYNLAVRRFAPTTDERQAKQLSTILHEWSSGVLEEFGIKVMLDVLTSTLDSGSDVKRTLDILIDVWWEWCISHLIHLALTEAFGTSIDPNNSKNVDARCFFQRIKKVIETVNKSEYLQGAFEEAMLELLETYFKLLNSPQHRWSSTALVLERILIAWEPLLQAYHKLNRPVPLVDMDHTLCIEFYSLIEPVRVVQIKAQAMQTFVIVDVYVMLYSLYTTVLDVSKPLELIIPVRRQLGSEDPYLMSQSHDVLQPATCEAQKFLGKAMSKRYSKRYHPILALHQPKKIYGNNLGRPMLQKNVLEETDFKFSYLIDAQSMLYPPMTSGKILVKLINATNIDRLDIPVGWTQESLQKQHFVFVNQFIWNKIRCLAKTVAAPIMLKKQQMAMGGSTPAGRLERPTKRVKTLELLSAALDIVAADDKKDVNGSGECFEMAA